MKFFEKGDRPLEFITTRQWFVRILEHKQALVEAGERVAWHPDFMRLRFRNWTENLNLDWCISRQRYFGVPFPVWYPVKADGATDFSAPIVADEAALPVDPMTAAPPGYAEGQRDQPGGFTAEADVFDTWFTSSLTPQIATGWTESPERHRRLFPMDLRPQSHEIIRTWAFYTIAKAWLHEGEIPWRTVAISGWVLDPDRKKMSKSKGNVVTPMHLLDQYGADAVRYWSLAARLGTDTAFDEKVFAVGRRLVMKVWNASKYALSQSAPEGPVAHPLDLGFLARLRDTVAKATAAFDDLDYAGALDTVERLLLVRLHRQLPRAGEGAGALRVGPRGARLGGVGGAAGPERAAAAARAVRALRDRGGLVVGLRAGDAAPGASTGRRGPRPPSSRWSRRGRPGRASTRPARSSTPSGGPRAPRARRSGASWRSCASPPARAPSTSSRRASPISRRPPARRATSSRLAREWKTGPSR